jgi:hypothetical protein
MLTISVCQQRISIYHFVYLVSSILGCLSAIVSQEDIEDQKAIGPKMIFLDSEKFSL